MARLSEHEVGLLVTALSDAASSGTPATRPSTLPSPDAPVSSEVRAAQKRLQELEQSGALGPIVTQRLAAYIGKPVRCACRATSLHDDGRAFQARSGNAVIWVHMESSLASALADAMIGGEGDPSGVGFNGRVLRLTACAALEFIRSIAHALDLPEPTALENDFVNVEGAAISGQLAFGSQEHAWRAGFNCVRPSAQVPPAAVASSARTTPNVAHPSERATGDMHPALSSARRRLAQLLDTEVLFAHQTVSSAGQGEMPEGWIRLGLVSREGGAVVLAVNRPTAIALARSAAKSGPLPAADSGTILETGAEVLLRETLCALAAALGSTQEEVHHVIRLGNEAMLADLPHVGIEHEAKWNGQTGHLRWLVPAHLIQSPGQPDPGRGR